MLDYSVDPPMYRCGNKKRERYLDILNPDNVSYENEYIIFSYNVLKLDKLTRYLMQILDISYDVKYNPSDSNDEQIENGYKYIKYEDMSEKDRYFYYPFGYILSCLCGNCFDNSEFDEFDLVKHYAADARYTILSNNHGLSEDEVKSNLIKYMKRSISSFEEGETENDKV